MAITCFQRKTDSFPSAMLSNYGVQPSRHPALPDVYSPEGGEISDLMLTSTTIFLPLEDTSLYGD